ncbi:MAG TPA: DUF202 domain-containing protein [Roseiarcus sp.]|nr:DUF202 domain-containing protein [Roseiarcus sp.]
MIGDYRDHAANERTFLAWARTGIAVIALGFVIERFNLFLLTVEKTLALAEPRTPHLERLTGAVGRYGGVSLIVGGAILMLIAALRFLRTRRELAATESHAVGPAPFEFFLLMAMVLFVAGVGLFTAVD